MISKTGAILVDDTVQDSAVDQSIVEITLANRRVYYQGFHLFLASGA